MTTETLSEKKYLVHPTDSATYPNQTLVDAGYDSYFLEKDVREFIKQLKAKTYWVNGHSQLCQEIDELAGKELIE